MHKEPTWQDVINFADRVSKELKTLIESDESEGVALLQQMNIALGLKQHATLEQEKEHRAVSL